MPVRTDNVRLSWPLAAVLLGLFALLAIVAVTSHEAIPQILTLIAGAGMGWLAPSPLTPARKEPDDGRA